MTPPRLTRTPSSPSPTASGPFSLFGYPQPATLKTQHLTHNTHLPLPSPLPPPPFPLHPPPSTLHPLQSKGYIELPYTLPQDFTLFILMGEKDITVWKKKLDWIAQHGGMALLITHPDYMSFGRQRVGGRYPVEYYEELLRYINRKYAGVYWNVVPKAVSDHCATNGSIRCERRETRKAPLHVCMVSYSFYENDGRVKRYAETLAERGDHVDVIALRKSGQALFETIKGVHVHNIQERVPDEKGKLSYLSRLARFLIRSSMFLSSEHLRNRYQLIHVHSVPDFEVFAGLLPKLTGAKLILDIHDIVPEFYASKFNGNGGDAAFKALVGVERASIRFSDHVIISNHIWEKKLHSRSVNPEKCTVILNYPDPALFSPKARTRKDNKFMMMYPGTLNWHQGLDLAIKAFAEIKVKAPEAEFHIYGRGSEIDSLRSLIEHLGLKDRVYLKDHLPLEEISEIMADADLGVIPKRNDPFGGEAFSTKSLEFMSLGVPVLMSATRIDKYYFNDSVVKFFEPDNAIALSGGDAGDGPKQVPQGNPRRERLDICG